MGVTSSQLDPEKKSSLSNEKRSLNRRIDQLPKDLLLIWLDENLRQEKGFFQNYSKILEKLSISIEGYSQSKECLEMIERKKEMKICLIITTKFFHEISTKILSMNSIESIYILSDDEDDDGKISTQLSNGKIRGIFRSIDSIYSSLKRDTRRSNEEILSLSILQSMTFNKSDYKQLNQLFLYWFLVKQIILDSKYEMNAYEQIGEFAREHYSDHPNELKVIEQFSTRYSEHSPIWWFTRETFIQTLLNRSFQTQDIEVIIKFSPFIQDLHRQLENIQKKMSRTMVIPPPLYRSKILSREDFEKLKTSEGNLLTFNHFFFADPDYSNVLHQAQRAKQINDQIIALLFQIEIHFEDVSSPFASLQGLAFAPEQEKLFLFSLQTIFRIRSIEQLEDRLWKIHLTMTDVDDRQILLLQDLIREETRSASQWYKLAKLMVLLRDFQQAKEIYHLLLNSLDENDLLKKSHIYNELGLIADEMGEYTLALSYYQKSIEMKQKCLPPNHRLLGVAYNNIGEVQRELGEYFNALSSHQKTLSIKQKTLPPNDISFARTYNNLGLANEALGDFSAALAFYQKALDIKRKVLSPTHIDLATTYNNIGELQREMGNYPAALTYFEKALSIRQKNTKTNDSSLAITYNNIGLIHREMGDYPKAIEFFEKSLQVKMKSYRENHPSLAISYLNIGDIHQQLGEFSDALESYEKALQIQQKSFPGQHPEIATTFNNIGVAHQSMGNYSTALTFYQKALKIRQKTLSSTHPAIGTSLNNIGHCQQLMGDYQAALEYYQKTLKIQEKSLRPNHPSLAATFNNIADIYRKLGNHKNALNLYKKALEIKKKSLSSSHPSLITTYNNIGVMHQAMGEYSAALDYYKKTLEIHQKSLPENHPDLAAIYNNIGVAHQSLKEYSKALECYKKALNVQEKSLPEKHADKATTHNSIATVYVLLEDYEKALSHEQSAVDMAKLTLPADHPNVLTFEDYLQRIQIRVDAEKSQNNHPQS